MSTTVVIILIALLLFFLLGPVPTIILLLGYAVYDYSQKEQSDMPAPVMLH